MGTIDEEFRAVVRDALLEDDVAEQLANAARTVATRGSMATAISSVCSVSPDRLSMVRALVEDLADRYDLTGSVDADPASEQELTCHVRFARRGDQAAGRTQDR